MHILEMWKSNDLKHLHHKVIIIIKTSSKTKEIYCLQSSFGMARKYVEPNEMDLSLSALQLEIERKNDEIRKRDIEIHERDVALDAARKYMEPNGIDLSLSALQLEIERKNDEIRKRDDEIHERDAEMHKIHSQLQNKDIQIQHQASEIEALKSGMAKLQMRLKADDQLQAPLTLSKQVTIICIHAMR